MSSLKLRYVTIVASVLLLAVYLVINSSRPSHDLIARVRNFAVTGNYDAVIADLNAAIQLTPDDPALYTLRGQMYLYLYEWDQVLADYNTAISLDPAYADAYYYRGVLYYTRNELDPALADFQYYLDLEPEGDHAEQAAQSIADIQTQQQALENS